MHNTTQNSSIVGGEIPETEADVNEQLKALSDSNLKMDYVYMPKDQSFDSTLIVGEMIKLRDGGMVVTTNPEKATAVKDAEQKEGLTKLQNGKLLDYLQPLDSELVGTEIVIEAKYNGNIINSQVVCPDLKDKVIADYAHRFPGAEIATTNVEDHVEARIPEDPFMSRQRFGSEEKTVIVVNDFYDDPDSVREYALSLSYNKDPMYSGYPGMRSKRFSLGPEFMEEVLSYVPPNDITTISSLFQYQTAADAAGSFIHPDPVEWAGVIYLNKDHDGEPGTSFYYHRNRKTGIMPMGTDLMFDAIEAKTSPHEYTEVFREDRLDESKWITLLTVPIRYNRLIMYNARQFHRNASAFGSSKKDARLVQGLFFSDAKTVKKNFAGISTNSPVSKS